MILTETREISDKIRAVLEQGNGRRIAIVAFVGRDAVKFVGDPAGLEVYCWPNGAATNPDGIRDLQDSGATVYFVDRLHMKLFWSEYGGYVIGSPNLSSSALDDSVATNLLESAIYGINSKDVSIDAILAQLKHRGVELATTKLLEELEDEYYNRTSHRSAQKHPKESAGRTTFNKYLVSASPASWSYVTWGDYYKASKADRVAANAYREENAGKALSATSSPISDSILTDLKKPSRWILAVKVVGSGTKIGKLSWIYRHTSAPYRKSTSLIQVKGAETPSAPFDFDSDNFKERLAAFLNADTSTNLEAAEGTFSITRFRKFENGISKKT